MILNFEGRLLIASLFKCDNLYSLPAIDTISTVRASFCPPVIVKPLDATCYPVATTDCDWTARTGPTGRDFMVGIVRPRMGVGA